MYMPVLFYFLFSLCLPSDGYFVKGYLAFGSSVQCGLVLMLVFFCLIFISIQFGVFEFKAQLILNL